MNKMYIEDMHDVTDKAIQVCEHIHNGEVLIVGFYEDVVEAFNMLMKETDAEFISGCLEDPSISGYENAYALSYTDDEIWIEKCYDDDSKRISMYDFDVAYVSEYFYDDFIKTNKTDNVVQFSFDEETVQKHDHSHDETCLCQTHDGTGFTFCIDDDTSHIKFEYKGMKKLTEDEIWQIISEQFK